MNQRTEVVEANAQRVELQPVVEQVERPLGNLAAALAVARSKCKPAPKDGKVSFGNTRYTYATAESIIDAARTALIESSIALMPISQELRSQGSHYELRRRFVLVHSSGESLPVVIDWPVVPERGRGLDKAMASAITTSLSYYLRDLLMMPRANPADDVAGRDDREEQEEQTPSPEPQETPPNPTTPPVAPSSQPEGVIDPAQKMELVGLYQQHKRGELEVNAILAAGGVKVMDRLPLRMLPVAQRILTEGLALEEQQHRVYQMMIQLGLDWEAVRKQLKADFGVTSLAHLTPSQMNHVEERLKVKAKAG